MNFWLGVLFILGAPACEQHSATECSFRPMLADIGVTDPRIVEAMELVPRADFLPEDERPHACEDRPLPIGFGQTTSQPSLIGYMLEKLALPPGCRVLEIGTGSGYQTALLGRLCDEVYSIEIVAPLARRAAETLAARGLQNVHVKAGDGYQGWPEAAPFDGVVVSAGAAKIPPALVLQLEPGGRLVIPVGGASGMRIELLTRILGGSSSADGSVQTELLIPVRFVPLRGDAADRDRLEQKR